MKDFFLCLFIIVVLLSCSNQESFKEDDQKGSYLERIEKEFQAILASKQLNGAILILDDSLKVYYSNDFEWAHKGQLPASTFKIPNSIIGLEAGVVNDSTIFKWDGQKRFLASWEEDLNLAQAFQRSCVPCYQEVARNIGSKRMNEWLDKLNYQSMVVTEDSIDTFWLRGNSRISPMEQIDFLRRLAKKELPISERTYTKMRDIMVLESNEKYTLRGKTGWSTDGKDNGWFVGFLEKGGKTYYFATNVEPKPDFKMEDFGKIRSLVCKEALNHLELL